MKETKEREAESKGQEKPDASAAAAKPAEEATDEEGNEEEEGDAEADVDTTKIVRTTPPLEVNTLGVALTAVASAPSWHVWR